MHDDLSRVRGSDERVLLRRTTDRVLFDKCPKFDRHELQHDQLVEIVEMAINRIRDQDNIAFAQYIKSEGKTLFSKLLVVLGTLFCASILFFHDKIGKFL